MTRALPLLLLAGACLLLAAGCPKAPKATKTKTAATVPGPPGSTAMSGAVERGKRWIQSGGTDAGLKHPAASPALAAFSMTTPIDLQGKEVKGVKLRGAVSRGPGKVAGLETFTMHDGKGATFTDVATYEVTYEMVLEGGGATQEVTVSLRPHQGQWYVLPPAPRK